MSNLVGQSREDCEEIAKQENLVAFFAAPDELFIDLDGDAVIDIKARDCMLKNGVSVIEEIITTSKNGGKHVYLKLNRPFSYAEAAALQAALGSDSVRELLTILTRDFSCLFEVPSEADKVKMWRSRNTFNFAEEVAF